MTMIIVAFRSCGNALKIDVTDSDTLFEFSPIFLRKLDFPSSGRMPRTGQITEIMTDGRIQQKTWLKQETKP
jgi:hypothetical protein